MGDRKAVHTRFRWGNLRERDHLEGPDVDGRISKRVCRRWDGGTDGLTWLSTGTVTDRCECGNEPTVSIKRAEVDLLASQDGLCFMDLVLPLASENKAPSEIRISLDSTRVATDRNH